MEYNLRNNHGHFDYVVNLSRTTSEARPDTCNNQSLGITRPRLCSLMRDNHAPPKLQPGPHPPKEPVPTARKILPGSGRAALIVPRIFRSEFFQDLVE